MRMFAVKPTVYKFDTAKAFAEEFSLNSDDLVITNEYIYQPYFGNLGLKCDLIYQEKYGTGEPSDDMFEAIHRDIKKEHKRIIAIGGGTVLDIAKLFALKESSPILDLYDGNLPFVKNKELILVPTTCGTGSEMTNVSVFALNSRGTKKGLAMDAMYGDSAILIPELLKGLPFGVFATSSIDALVHAVESSLSPKGNPMTRLFGYKAIEMLIKGYQKIRDEGKDARLPLLEDFLLASNYAGISFSIGGCAGVHAMAYPLGGKYHVPHGESNYVLFTGVLKNYLEIKQDGELATMLAYLADLLGCSKDQALDQLDELLSVLLPKKPLRDFGMTEEDLDTFADSVVANQQRLLANNYVPLDRDRIYKIYKELH